MITKFQAPWQRKSFLLYLGFLVCVLLFLNTVPGAGEDAQVGVRITGETFDRLHALELPFEVLIDYNAFLWGVLPASSLSELDQLDIHYQVYASPFALSTAKGDIDPLAANRHVSPMRSANTEGSGPELYLLQFYGPTKGEWLSALKAN